MKVVRWSALAALLAGLAVLVPSSAKADGEQTIAYTCNETDPDNQLVPELSAAIAVTATDSADPVKVFQPVTWTAEVELPDIQPPISVALSYLRVRIPIPTNITAVAAQLSAPVGQTPNPALSDVSVEVTPTEVVVQLPESPNPSQQWVQARSAAAGGGLYYPVNFLSPGSPIVPPVITITGVPAPSASGATVSWSAPEFDTELVYLGDPDTVSCRADPEPDPSIVDTAVTTTRQLCAGQPVTVQVGFNTPTNGADVIQGTPANDTVNALAGNDRFCGLDGGDTYNGGGGDDRALGGAGNDKLRGDAGDDNLQGGANNDTLIGGANRDTCNGGPQTDTASTCEVRQSIP